MEREAQTFPELTPAQVARIASIGRRREVRAGEVLFEAGDQNTQFFVVLSGAIQIVRRVGEREEPMAVHGPGHVTGEINMLSARRSLVRARRRRAAPSSPSIATTCARSCRATPSSARS
jgi:thioredoxin reductase (NADPH)